MTKIKLTQRGNDDYQCPQCRPARPTFPPSSPAPTPLFRKRVLQQLAARNCFAEEACGGAEALALIEEGACRTLLLDQFLPDLDVGELVAMIRARHPQVEVLVLDSQGTREPWADDLGLSPGLE